MKQLESKNLAILAAAGSRKTDYVTELAISSQGQVLILTYTNENLKHINKRLIQKSGVVPSNIETCGWFSFLIRHCAKPYQRVITGSPFYVNSLNFKGRRPRYIGKNNAGFFLDSAGNLYRDGVSDFAVRANALTSGAVIRRLESLFDHILIDEFQDLVGFDLDFIELLMRSRIKVTIVGDPRQHTLATNMGSRNKKYRGAGLSKWFHERKELCFLTTRNESFRCNQEICDFADSIYPDLEPTVSRNTLRTGHDGIFYVPISRVHKYVQQFDDVVSLRNDKKASTYGLPAMNIGISKGSTFDRVLIFPTKPMLEYLSSRNPSILKAPERLYVAVTRAKFSVAFAVPDDANLELFECW